MKVKTKPALIVEDVDGSSLMTHIPAAVQRALDVLKNYADGRVVTTRRLSQLIGMSAMGFREHSTHPALAPHRARVGTFVYWGSAKTISGITNE